MEKPKRLVIDCMTGEQALVEYTDEEIARAEADRIALEAERAAQEAAETDKAAKRSAAIVKLKALGLTEDEVTALL